MRGTLVSYRFAVHSRIGGPEPDFGFGIHIDAVRVTDARSRCECMPLCPERLLHVANQAVLFVAEHVGKPLVVERGESTACCTFSL